MEVRPASGRLWRGRATGGGEAFEGWPQTRRLLAFAAVYEGATRTEAAKVGGVTLQVVRNWVLKFNAHGPNGLIDGKAPGQKPLLNEEHCERWR